MKNDNKLRQALIAFVDSLNNTDKVEYAISFGRDERITEGKREFIANNTKTLTIKVNGGTHDSIIC